MYILQVALYDLSIYLSICVRVCVSMCVCVCARLSTHLSIYLPTYLAIYLAAIRPCLYFSLIPSFRPPPSYFKATWRRNTKFKTRYWVRIKLITNFSRLLHFLYIFTYCNVKFNVILSRFLQFV